MENRTSNVGCRTSRLSRAAARLVCLSAVFAALAADAAPAKGDAVAEGYLDWVGVVQKNFLTGRLITPSDLRHRAVVYVVLDGSKLSHETLPKYTPLATLAPLPASHAMHWDTKELPRNKIVVVSVRNLKKTPPEEFAAMFKPAKNASRDAAAKYTAWTENMVSFYKDLSPIGEADITDDKMPYVAIYGGSGTEPLYKKEKWDDSEMKAMQAAMKKALSGLDKNWKPPFGVTEPQFFAKTVAEMEKGKSAQGILPLLKAGIKSKNPDQAKEAQIMFDALNQYRGDLILRVQLEYRAAPARACYDLNTLVKNFPSDKKHLQAVDSQLKANKEAVALGKILDKVMVWSADDYVCKSAGEAKKNVQELQKFKKTLELLAQSKNAKVQGEAMLFQTQVDTLIELMPSKAPQK